MCIGHKMSCRNYFLFWKNKNTLTESFHTSHQGNPNWSTGPILDTQSEKIMQEMGLEPTRSCDHRHLKPARLPIPPLLHFISFSRSLRLPDYNTSFHLECQHLFLFFLDFIVLFLWDGNKPDKSHRPVPAIIQTSDRLKTIFCNFL